MRKACTAGAVMCLLWTMGCAVTEDTGEVREEEPLVTSVAQGLGADCTISGVVDRGWVGDLHYWEIYGDFRCGHDQSVPSLVTPATWPPSSCYNVRSVSVTYSSTFQVNVAMGTTWVASCTLGLSSWNNHVADIQFAR